MLKTGIIAYTATEQSGKVTVTRACVGNWELVCTDNWDELTEFLTEDKGVALHICWNLEQFSNRIFGLLPIGKQRELGKKVKVEVDRIKIFSTEHLLGITKIAQVRGNIYERLENNFYGISHWLPSGTKEPKNAEGLEQLGYEIIEGLDKLGIYPSKLTSPIGVFADKLDSEKLPTIYNFNEDYIEAMEWADRVARYEWNKEYKKDDNNVYEYDLTSAYPYFMLDLLDTRFTQVAKVNKLVPCDWGIVKGKLISNIKVLPVNKKAEYFTTEEIEWIEKNKVGKFELNDGWYFKFKDGHKPYRATVSNLLKARSNGSIMSGNIAKKVAQGLSGKLDQYNRDGGLGELYNPILALMVRSRCRLAVGDFIFDNGLQDELAKVVVDCVYTTKELVLPNTAPPGQFRMIEL